MSARRLTLRQEPLAPLSPDDMALVGGGADASAGTCYSCADCLRDRIVTSLKQALTDCYCK